MEHTSLYFDVVIVGAGPAGSTCALALKNADLKVALLDKTSFPRDKICGDAIPTRVVKVLNRIDQKYVEALRKFELAVSVKSTRVVAPSGKSFTVHWKNEAFNCKRTDFDHLLFNWAKTETSTAIFENTPVLSVTNNNDCIHLHTPGNTFIAPIVIACDGAHSILAKKLNNFTVDKEKYSGAVRAYPNGVIGNTHHLNEIFFSKNLMPGYFWLFPVSESCSNVGLGMLSATIASKKINLKKSLANVVAEFPELTNRFSKVGVQFTVDGFGLTMSDGKTSLSGNQFLLCGDAGSLIDPLSGDGIGNAMVSAWHAAEHVKKFFTKNIFTKEINIQYDNAVYKELGKELKRNYRIMKICSKNPWLIEALIHFFSSENFLSTYLKKKLNKYI